APAAREPGPARHPAGGQGEGLHPHLQQVLGGSGLCGRRRGHHRRGAAPLQHDRRRAREVRGPRAEDGSQARDHEEARGELIAGSVKRGAAKGRSGRRGAAARRPARSPFTLGELARALGGAVAGDAETRLTGVQPLDRAGPEDLSWIAEERHAGSGARSLAGALLVSKAEHAGGRPAVIVPAPTVALAEWLTGGAPAERPRPGIGRGAFVSRAARIGRGVSVAAGATVESGARVGAGSVIGANAFVGRDAEIGEDCVVYPGAVVLDRC